MSSLFLCCGLLSGGFLGRRFLGRWFLGGCFFSCRALSGRCICLGLGRLRGLSCQNWSLGSNRGISTGTKMEK